MAKALRDTSQGTGWDGLLDPGETVLWQGRPGTGISLRGLDIFMIVFGLFFGGFALFWMVMAAAAGGFFWAFGLLHFSVGAGIVLWPLAGRPYVRRNTHYSLTNKRAYIATKTPFTGKRLRSYPIDEDTVLILEDGARGSVFFASERHRTKRGTSERPVGFEQITQVREVYSLLRRIQRGEA